MLHATSFEWDQANIRHMAAHGISVEEVEYVLAHPTLDLGYQIRFGEGRFAEAGATAAGRILQDEVKRMPMTVPQFQNEDEEAQWWYDHRDEIGADLVAASREGHSGEGTLGRNARRAARVSESFAVHAVEARLAHIPR